MDSQKLGPFIAERRKQKGLTQRNLADRLNVTDKAVSKWERGLGLPDLKMIQPLAEALDVSILEIMQGECSPQEEVPKEHASRVLSDVIDIALFERKLARRNTAIACLSVLAVVSTLFLISIRGVLVFALAHLPYIMFGIGIILLISSLVRWRKGLSFLPTLIGGLFTLLYPLMVYLLAVFAMALGGPVPN